MLQDDWKHSVNKLSVCLVERPSVFHSIVVEGIGIQLWVLRILLYIRGRWYHR
jgi:hypothetical protein